MRLVSARYALLACLALSACSTGSAVDVLNVAPSREVTSSIMPSAGITPPAAVGATQQKAEAIALADSDRLDTPALQQVAMVMPPRPASRSGNATRRNIYSPSFSDAHPIAFGKVTPAHHSIHGVDVSRWQGEIDWQKLRSQGANFAFIKATDGGDHLDPMFHKNWKAAEAAGIRRGAYHFFYWCRTGAEQADWLIRNVPREPGALPPVLDVEWNHLSQCRTRPAPNVVRAKMQAFLTRVEEHYGQRPIIYVTPDFYEENLEGHFKEYPFWVRSVAAHPSVRYPNRNWVFWQYSGTGLSKGVTGKIDLNVFRGDEEVWHRWVTANTH